MAESDDDASKTEDPSPRKLSKAHDKGQTAQSQEIKHWAMLLGSTVALMVLGPKLAADMQILAIKFIEQPEAIATDSEHLRLVFAEVSLGLLWILFPVFGLLMIFAVGATVGQSGLIWAPAKIEPELQKISLLTGFKRMFSVRSMVEFTKGMIKLSVVGAIALGVSMPLLQDLAILPLKDFTFSLDRILAVSVRLGVATVAVMTVIAALDYGYQKFSFLKQMRMSKQEVKDEHKQSEGDPQIKARIRKLRTERARRRMMKAIPKADVVITNPTHFSVALEYKMDSMSAPKVVAKGVDHLAFKIREIAKAHDVPLVENPPLARALYAAVEIDEEIPVEHYKAVAEVIGYVMRLKGKLPQQAM